MKTIFAIWGLFSSIKAVNNTYIQELKTALARYYNLSQIFVVTLDKLQNQLLCSKFDEMFIFYCPEYLTIDEKNFVEQNSEQLKKQQCFLIPLHEVNKFTKINRIELSEIDGSNKSLFSLDNESYLIDTDILAKTSVLLKYSSLAEICARVNRLIEKIDRCEFISFINYPYTLNCNAFFLEMLHNFIQTSSACLYIPLISDFEALNLAAISDICPPYEPSGENIWLSNSFNDVEDIDFNRYIKYSKDGLLGVLQLIDKEHSISRINPHNWENFWDSLKLFISKQKHIRKIVCQLDVHNEAAWEATLKAANLIYTCKRNMESCPEFLIPENWKKFLTQETQIKFIPSNEQV